ncbi:c-type cytochrome [Rubellimicrobium arenae]|uniref:c-type cytochrome n=1 Tax=Rubellimicrobium arenae TaxID=2817372 RepID=UPI001B30D489|nr:c-type cytochrome [Rubellimicrobium arenae]
MRRLILLAPLALMACVPDPHEDVSGRNAFLESCAGCHGVDAKGTGAMAAGLDPRPADLTTIAARHGGPFPRDYVMSVIDGFARGAHFSPAMPEFGATDMGDTVIVEETPGVGTPIPERLLALADYLESIQEP